jgi:hypothetical protein
VLEIFVDIHRAACAPKAAVVAQPFVQQEHQLTAVSYFVPSAQHSYQIQTAVLYVIIAQADLLAAVMVAILTAVAVFLM